MTLRIGSRGSALALWQTEHVKASLETLHSGLQVSIEILATTGDRILDVPLAKIGDKGLFTKELDRAILEGRVDAAVHSLKDVPTRLEEGLRLAAILPREDPCDAFVAGRNAGGRVSDLPSGAVVGTSSLRRRAQLMALRPDLEVRDLRGNLNTRLDRLDEGRYDGVILALVGLRRLGFEARVTERLEPPAWLPAAGQGALAVVAREDDEATLDRLGALDDSGTRAATAAERAFLAALEGGCQIPIGALAGVEAGRLTLHGLVAALDGEPLLRGVAEGDAAEPVALGRRLAEDLRGRGADAILDEVRRAAAADLPEASAP